MSKERAQRREVREREAAARAETRAAAAARDARRRQRRAAWSRRFALLRPGRGGQPTGILAQRRRTRLNLLLVGLFLVQVVVWVVRPDWPARLAALVIALLAFPVLAAFTL